MKTHTLDFGTFRFYRNMVVGEFNEGVHVDLRINQLVTDLLNSYFSENQNFGYISNRKYKYSMNPMVHYVNRSFTNLKCFAVVEHNGIPPSTASIESKFFISDRFQTFLSIDDAMTWVDSMLKSQSNS